MLSVHIAIRSQRDLLYWCLRRSRDPERRLRYHNSKNKGYTQKYRPWRIVYTKLFDTKAEALAAEKKIKGWKSKKMTKLVIEGGIDILNYIE